MGLAASLGSSGSDVGVYDPVAVTLIADSQPTPTDTTRAFEYGRQTLVLDDCLNWLRRASANSISAVVTDPPYGLVEYRPEQQKKLREGRGGVWRIPPSFDGSVRRPLPRFTVLTGADRRAVTAFFGDWASELIRVVRPGAHVFIAGNPLVSPLVSASMEASGFERRGEVVRLVRTFRGGDRPKGAEDEFPSVSSMPRSCWEPWGLYRKPIDQMTLAENLRVWGTGGLRRISDKTPFLDVIESGVTPGRERLVAPHPSVKPQAFLRQIVRASLPLGTGTVLDPFAGCATTLAACEALGVRGIGIEVDDHFFQLAAEAIPKLAVL